LFLLSFAQADIFCGDKDCYEILGVEKTATAREIKQAYYKLSLLYHPDKNKEPGADKKIYRREQRV